MTTRDIKFTFLGDAKSLQTASGKAGTALEGVSKKMTDFGKNAQQVGKSMSTKFTLPIVAAFGFGAKSIIENEQLLAQTSAVIESTGGAANVTAGHVEGLAKSISNYSGIAHESIIEGENMLLTFKNVRNEAGEGNDVFDQSTVLLADMSQAMGTNMKDAAIQMGKALNDPISGISALSRVGITFTDDQKDMIKGMVEAGDVMGAQKIILGELESQFGGSAKAAGETMGGQLKIMKNNAEEAARGLVTALLPAISNIATGLSTVINWFNELSPGMKTAITVVLALVAAIGPLISIIGTLSVALGFLAANPIVLVIAALAAIGVGLFILFKKNEEFRDGVLAVWDVIKGIFEGAMGFIKDVIETVTGIISGIWERFGDNILEAIRLAWDNIKIVVETAINIIKGVIDTVTALIKGDWEGVWNGIKDIAMAVWEGITGLIGNAIDGIKLYLETVLEVIRVAWELVWSGISGFLGEIWGGITGVVETSIDAVKGTIDRVLGSIKTLWSNAWTAVRTRASEVWNVIKLLAEGFISGVRTIITDGFNIFKTFWNNAWGGIRDFFTQIWETIKSVALGAWNWINNNVISPIVNAINAVKGALDSLPSPSDISLGGVDIGGVGDSLADIISPFTNPLDSFSDVFNMFRHTGGPVVGGHPYIIKPDEEVFIPRTGGDMVLNRDLPKQADAAFHLHFHGPVIGSTRELADVVAREIAKAKRQNGAG
jgi:phage-related protein